MNVITFNGVTLQLSGKTVLEDIHLDIPQGRFIGLFGPNGAGKTTLLRSILGLISPAKGEIQVIGHPVRRGNPDIAYIPQIRTPAHLRLRGWDFVASALNGNQWGWPWLNRQQRHSIDHALASVGALPLANRTLAELSGGERQRLLLAQAMLGNPKLILMDEPLASLDPGHQQHVLQLVKQVQQEQNITVIFSAHDINPMLGVMDDVLYLGHKQAVLGDIDTIMTSDVLSRLYHTPIDVVRIKNNIFVMSGNTALEQQGFHEHV